MEWKGWSDGGTGVEAMDGWDAGNVTAESMQLGRNSADISVLHSALQRCELWSHIPMRQVRGIWHARRASHSGGILNTHCHLYNYMYASTVCVQQGGRERKRNREGFGVTSSIRFLFTVRMTLVFVWWVTCSIRYSRRSPFMMLRICSFPSSTYLAIRPTGNIVENRWVAVLLMLSMREKSIPLL